MRPAAGRSGGSIHDGSYGDALGAEVVLPSRFGVDSRDSAKKVLAFSSAGNKPSIIINQRKLSGSSYHIFA